MNIRPQDFLSHEPTLCSKLAISVRAPFFGVASSICVPFFVRSISYSRAILISSQSLFARHSEKRCVLFFFGFAQWNISIVVFYISLPLYMGKSEISFKKTFCLMNIRPQDFLSHEPTLWFRRH